MFSFHHSESDVSLASTLGEDGRPEREESVSDTGIKLPPGAQIFKADIAALRPTQLAVGMQQVQVKMDKAKKKAKKGPEVLDDWLKRHPIPVVMGPGNAMYLIDHHHLSRALHECGIKTCYAGVARDMSDLEPAAFWKQMAAAGCLWQHNHVGEAVPQDKLPELLPATVADLQDDPYRSLAALVRKAGGYQKTARPFSEFMWANFLRPRVPLALEKPTDVTNFVDHGVSHATSPDAAHLPGHTPAQAAAGGAAGGGN